MVKINEKNFEQKSKFEIFRELVNWLHWLHWPAEKTILPIPPIHSNDFLYLLNKIPILPMQIPLDRFNQCTDSYENSKDQRQFNHFIHSSKFLFFQI
jgi:hypothetical protein